MNTRRFRKGAFTLIELLIVIAIIALLLSIALPALRKAKDKAKDVICRTRVKGIGTAILLYLNDYDSRAFNNRDSNGHLWYDANGKVITPENTAWWADAYWGLGYREYTSDEKVFSCPSFVLKDMAELVYSDRANYKTTRTDLQRASGYGLNSFFFRDLDASSTDPMRYNRKVGSLRSPSRFIVTHDHMEPKLEGDSTSGGEQNDMFYIPAGGTYNLLHYRTGDRKPYYGGIFRHCKISKAWDEPANLAARLTQVDKSPNGNVNVLFLDGSTDKLRETTGQNIPYSMYRGPSR
jgi:prepilin-type N-terminal cleavage/methylation domain-containing protein/prepilin-type processing-associated H-X9-DG protein